jgi:hypothetical protein
MVRPHGPLAGWTVEEHQRWVEAQTLNSALARWRANPDDLVVRRELDDWLQSSAGGRTDLPPETNLGLGQYLILENNRWDDGLRRLVLSNGGPWRAAAELDLTAAYSDDVPTWLDCGDDWWWLSDDPQERVVDRLTGLTDQHRLRLRERAALWYHKALPYLDEQNRARIQERLKFLDTWD